MHEYRRFVQAELDKRSWTPGGFARIAGMHRQTIAKIVNDTREHIGQMPDESTLEAIANGFNIDVILVRQAAARSLDGYVMEPAAAMRDRQPAAVPDGTREPAPSCDLDQTAMAQIPVGAAFRYFEDVIDLLETLPATDESPEINEACRSVREATLILLNTLIPEVPQQVSQEATRRMSRLTSRIVRIIEADGARKRRAANETGL